MADRFWRFPWLRRRSRLERGIYSAVAVTLIFGLATFSTSHNFSRNPSQELLIGIGGVGATFYIAYLVGVSSLIREIRVRDGQREYFVGALGGLGFCGLFAIAFIFILAGEQHPLHWLERFAFCWGSVSLFFLGAGVASLPLVAYDAARSVHINPEE